MTQSNNVGHLRAPTHPTFGRLILPDIPHVLFTLLQPSGFLPAQGRLELHQIGPKIGEAWWSHNHYHLRFDNIHGQEDEAIHCVAEGAPNMQHLIRLRG